MPELAAALAATLVLAGCGAPANGPLPGEPADAATDFPARPASERIEHSAEPIEFFVSASPVEMAIFDEILAGFRKRHPDVEVRIVNVRRDYATVLLTRIAGGEGPDVVMVDGKWTSDWIGRGLLHPLDEHIAGSRIATSDFVPQLIEASRGPDGMLYGIPSTYSTLALVVNDDMLAAAGFDRPPRTWAELIQYADRLERGGAVGLCVVPTWERMYAFALQNGGDLVTADWKQMRVTDPSMVDTFRWLADMLARSSVAQPQELGASWCGDALGKELAAMVLEGAWLLPPMSRQYPEVGYSVHPLPAGKRPATLAYMGMFAMTSTTAQPDAAWLLLEHLGSPAAQRIWAKSGLSLPARLDVEPPTRLLPFRAAVETATVWRVPPGFYNTVLMTVDNEMSAVLEGERTVDQMIAEIDKVGQTILGVGGGT